MKIIHPSGQPYDLFPGTDIELTRYNPFFNELGEQSIPISLPGSPRNMELLNHPGRADNNIKSQSRIDAVIQSGAFSAKARQAILSAKRNSTIETSFYLNEGAFYEKTRYLTLHDIFAGERIQFDNVASAATFVFTLMSGVTDNRMSCFMVYDGTRILNRPDSTRNGKFYYHIDREETIDEKQVVIPAGMYITPFVKVKYVLQQVIEYLGYTLSPSFMDVPPFNNMVFLNNNADTIVSGSINYVDIVPEITVNELFDLFRKFNCEIIPDEIAKTVTILNFDSILDEQPAEDLTGQKDGDLTISYHNDYKQLVLTSDVLHLQDNNDLANPVSEESTSLTDLSRKYPSAKIDTDGSIYRIGYKGEKVVKDRIGSLHMSYNAGDEIPVEERNFPDVLVDVSKSAYFWQTSGGAITIFDVLYPYVGQARNIRTQLVFTQEEELQAQEESLNSTSTQTLKPMLCLYYHDVANQINIGTIHNYSLTGTKLWNYTLAYNGKDGIFEKFWRKYDALLRNAFLDVRGDFILTETQKMTMSSHSKIIVDSQMMIANQINYVPGRRMPMECRFFSTKLQEPVSIAKTMDEYFPHPAYKWEFNSERNFINSIPALAWEVIKYKHEPVIYYPEAPTLGQYSAGGRYYEKQFEVEYGFSTALSYVKQGEGIITTYLEAVLDV